MSLRKEGQQEPDLDMQDEQEGKAIASVPFLLQQEVTPMRAVTFFTRALFSQTLECYTLPKIWLSLAHTYALSLIF